MATFASLADRKPRLAALARLVACADPGSDPQWCANGFWQRSVKPLLVPLVGHGRGLAPRNAPDPDGTGDPWAALTGAAVLAAIEDGHRWTRPVTTVAEELLRSQRAWDVAVEHLYGLLPACRDCGCLREVAA